MSGLDRFGRVVSNLFTHQSKSLVGYGLFSGLQRYEGVMLYDAAMVAAASNPTGIVTSASGAFNSSDVGKSCSMVSQDFNSSNGQTRTLSRAGTILQVDSPNQVRVSFSAPTTNFTGCLFAYGIDVGPSLQVVMDSLSINHGGAVEMPNGIFMSSIRPRVPNNVALVGRACAAQANGAGASINKQGYYGTSLIYCGDVSATDPFVMLGDGVDGLTAPGVYDINLDCFQRTLQTLSAKDSWGANVEHVCAIGGTQYTYENGSSTTTRACYFVGMGRFDVVSMSSSDNRFNDSYIWGPARGRYHLNVNNSGNHQISDLHWFRGKNQADLEIHHGVVIFADGTGGNNFGNITLANISSDHPGGIHARVRVFNSATLRAVKIIGMTAFQNQFTPNGLSCIDLRVDAGAKLLGFTAEANDFRASWTGVGGSTDGRPGALIEGTEIAGTVRGAKSIGNTMLDATDDAVLYKNFTPGYTAGNCMVKVTGDAQTWG